MKAIESTLFLALVIGSISAQERIPQEQATKYAALFVEAAAKLTDLQVKTDVDSEKPFGVKGGDLGAMVIPDKKLSEDVICKAGKDMIPVGQLWLRKLSTVVDGKATGNDKLRIVTITVNTEDHPLPLFLLGVRKKGDDTLELAVYAKDKEPHLLLPLQKIDTKQELPIELEAMKGDNETGVITLNILGKYRAKLTVGKQE